MAGQRRDVVISVEGLRTQFGAHVVHDHLDLEVYRGEVIGVVGASGSGKSVLLRTIVGLMQQATGTIRLFGKDTSMMSDEERKATERRWGVQFQDGALFSSLSVLQNVETPMREQFSLSEHLMRELAEIKISMVGLGPDAAPKLPYELSGGMRKRAGLARALALDPEVVFLDEPTAGLDPIGAAAYDELIKRMQQTLGLTVFMVTHDLDSLYAICDRIAVLADKRVIVIGTMEDMLASTHPWVREYFHGPRARLVTHEA